MILPKFFSFNFFRHLPVTLPREISLIFTLAMHFTAKWKLTYTAVDWVSLTIERGQVMEAVWYLCYVALLAQSVYSSATYEGYSESPCGRWANDETFNESAHRSSATYGSFSKSAGTNAAPNESYIPAHHRWSGKPLSLSSLGCRGEWWGLKCGQM